MNRRTRFAGIGLLALLAVSAATALETDDEYNRLAQAGKAFYKADQNRDGKLTAADGKGWQKQSRLDKNGDGTVTRQEFIDGFVFIPPKWNGKALRNVVCKRVGKQEVLLDIYYPPEKKRGRAPVLYYIHGGGWSGGTKEIEDVNRHLFEALAKEGFVCVSVMYRLVKPGNPNDSVVIRDCAVDAKDGLRFLKKHEKELGVDMDRVVAFGFSAGSHLTQLVVFSGPGDFPGAPALAAYSVQPVGGISWSGPCDFQSPEYFESKDVKPRFSGDHWASRAVKLPKGKSVYDHPDQQTRMALAEISPVCYLKKDSAPLFHAHGAVDPVISVAQAHHLEAVAQKTGAPVEVLIVEGAGHGFWNKNIKPTRAEVEQRSIDFAIRQAGAGAAQ